MVRYLLTAHKGKVIATVVLVAVLVSFGVLGLVLPGQARRQAWRCLDATATPAGVPLSSQSAEQRYNTLSPRELAMLDAAPDVTPATTVLLPAIPASDRTQPDLYARAFFTALFTHPYLGVTRAQLLAWVQAQQAVSPFITGGTAAERNRLLVESATDPDWSNSGFAAVPDDAGWAQAVAGRARVRIDRLTCVIPPDWETAISDGDITDPGLTARLVSADMTMTWTQDGQRTTQRILGGADPAARRPTHRRPVRRRGDRRHHRGAGAVTGRRILALPASLLAGLLVYVFIAGAGPAHATPAPRADGGGGPGGSCGLRGARLWRRVHRLEPVPDEHRHRQRRDPWPVRQGRR